ncbi:phage holin family protein [Enterocloster asparagiformis]|uniref:phage holin family protein n=1 Tax=Enterocloster asparagiformis TaxID=333367 RepID=UPI002A803569|nr:phage holin family protein [Enterocloster asparagiformis]
MEFTQYIKPEMLVPVSVLWLIGNALKRTPKVPDRLIPYILGIMGVAGCSVWVCATRNITALSLFTAFTQGILVAETSVWGNRFL